MLMTIVILATIEFVGFGQPCTKGSRAPMLHRRYTERTFFRSKTWAPVGTQYLAVSNLESKQACLETALLCQHY